MEEKFVKVLDGNSFSLCFVRVDDFDVSKHHKICFHHLDTSHPIVFITEEDYRKFKQWDGEYDDSVLWEGIVN